MWNNFSSPLCNIDISVRQELALAPILSVLYLFPIFHILEKHLKILKIPISVLSFINNRLFISQNKLLSISNTNLFYSCNVILSLLMRFDLIMKHSKIEVFYFSRLHRAFNPPPLDLTSLSGPIWLPKPTWRYLDFIFDHKLFFWSHIDFYVNKAISTIKCMKMLGNSLRGLIPLQKRWLYKCCTLSIALYSFQLWYYNKVPLYYLLNILRKMQWRAAIWITGAFYMLPTADIKAISSLIPVHLHLKKLYNRFLLKGFLLP